MTQSPPKSIIVFDFDGTITTRDTFAMFLRYYKGVGSWLAKVTVLLPTFIRYKLGLIDRHAVKKAVIKRFFAGEKYADINAKAEQFAAEVIPTLIRPKAQARLDELLKGPKATPESLYICSASIAPYLKAWARTESIPEDHVLAVELEAPAGVCSGNIHGYNVWGKNKVRRISDEFAPQSIVIEEAYGDSRGDKELLHAAEASFFRPFRV